jgi:hypothetical protein
MSSALRCLVAAGIAMAAAAALSACGGASGQTSTTERVLTKKQYLRQAHAICYRMSKKQVRATEAFVKRHRFDLAEPGRREREQMIPGVVVPVAKEKLAELKKLPPPKGDEGEVSALLRAIEKGIRDAEAHPRWLAEPTLAHEQPFEQGIDLWAEYGDWLCGQAGG